MPVVYAGVVPHAPLLLPTIAKDHQQLLAVTRQQLELMARELHARQVDILVILTPHSQIIPGTVVIDVADTYHGNLREFGDVRTTVSASGAPAAVHRLKEVAERAGLPVALQTVDQLDYGATVPLHFFQQAGSQWRLVPISVAGQTVATLLRLGSVLHEFFHSGSERYALIASADLDRRTTKNSGGVDQRPTSTERKIAEALTKLDPSLIASIIPPPSDCGYNPMIAFLASLQPTAAIGQVKTFEAPFGVGQMTATVDIPS